MNRALLFCAILTLWTPRSRADDDTPHNIYHSLKRFFTGSDGHHASASPSHHRAPKRTPPRSATQGPAEAGPSTTPEATVLPENSPAHKEAGEATPSPSVSRPSAADNPTPSPDRSPADDRVVVLPAASPVSPDVKPAPAGSPVPSGAASPSSQSQP